MSGERLDSQSEQNTERINIPSNQNCDYFDSRVEQPNSDADSVTDSLTDSVSFSFDDRLDSSEGFNESYRSEDDFDSRLPVDDSLEVNNIEDNPNVIDDTPYDSIATNDEIIGITDDLAEHIVGFHDYLDGDAASEDYTDGLITGNESKIVEYIITKNESLENSRHPVTGVEFERKTVDHPSGRKVEGVFPKFESEFTAKIPKEMYQSSDKVQFCECNKQLSKAIADDPELAKKFTPEQIDQIKEGESDGTAPDGYVWHHNEEAGTLQLVDFDTHSKTGHTGGRAIWGGGSDNR